VASLQQESKVQEKLNKSPEFRRAYHYKRAWAIACGYYNTDKATRDVFDLCDKASIENNQEFSSIISTFIKQWSLHYPQALKYQSKDWNQLLTQIETEPLQQRMDYPYYLQVTVLYTGSSNTKGGEWLSMVERRVKLLKNSKLFLNASSGSAC
jgi:hypothetical protein